MNRIEELIFDELPKGFDLTAGLGSIEPSIDMFYS